MSDQLSHYDYELPTELIAQRPVSPRDASRLLVLDRKSLTWKHRTFRDLPEYFGENDLLVANNTKVIRARLLGHRVRLDTASGKWEKGGKVEFVMLEEIESSADTWVWEGLFHASAKYVAGLKFEIPTPDGSPLEGELIRGSAESPSGTVVAKFNRDPSKSGAGQIPLPHYIVREKEQLPDALEQERQNYQTLYGKIDGSAAAPTAGFHFTENTFKALKEKKAQWDELTLHVGLGTFRPVKTEDLSKHVMHEERYMISPESAEHITQWRNSKKRVTAVGTTSVRTLESAWDAKNQILRSGWGRTQLFIRPSSTPGDSAPFQVVDQMITNFHLPKSTLLMLISAFAGREFVLEAYREAVREKYRFFSYGDAMLIL